MSEIVFTKVIAAQPKVVTKQFWLDAEGNLQKQTTAMVKRGSMQRLTVADAENFAEVLAGLRTNECLVYGVPPRDDAELVTSEAWAKLGKPDNPLPRAKDVFAWPSGAGVLLLDYDAPKNGTVALDRDALLAALEQAAPNMAMHDRLWWPSTSSLIFDAATGKELSGIKGQRLYPLVLDATDIPRAGTALNERLWLAGYGRYEVSKSGSLLERPLFDGSVWQTNRIDFAAGADCHKGLEQRRGKPLVLHGIVGGLLDTRTAIPDLNAAEAARVKAAKEAARAEVAHEATQARADWVEERADEFLRRNPRLEREEARKVIRRAAERRDLMGDWVLNLRDANGMEFDATVLEVLDNPAKFHGMHTRDPLEPNYDGGRFVGKLFLFGARPCLNSFAHGGAHFRLTRQPHRIEVVKGKGTETTDALLQRLRISPDVFDFGHELVVVGPHGSVHALDESGLRYEAGRITQFWHWHKLPDGGTVEALLDPPPAICKNTLSLGKRRGLKPLTAVVTAPTLRPDGSVLSAPGYDNATGLLFDAESLPMHIPEAPTRRDSVAALEFLLKPFEAFPFATPLDRAVHLAALLTAAVRPILPTSPAFAYDAPVQGSGKTLLARCVGILTEGKDPAVWPHTGGRDDEEVRKRLFTVLRSGARSMIWDNVVGTFDSAALASALTNSTFSDRILGASQASEVPNRMVMLLTGNNLSLAGDLPRRVLVSRIDPQTDKPYARAFDLDPAAYCLAHRQRMLGSALVLIRAMLTHGCAVPGAGKMASFEQWDAWVRQAVIYANELQPDRFGDVMDAVNLNQAADPEQEALRALLAAWETSIGTARVQTAEVVKRATECFTNPQLREALEEFLPHGRLNAKSVGKMLAYRKDRVCNGLRLESAGEDRAGRWWRLVKLPLDAQ